MGIKPSLVAEHPALMPLLSGGTSAQRARLLAAITEVVAAKGYDATTVADVVAGARISRSTFYELFASKEECFLEAYRHGIDVLVVRIEQAVAADPGSWEEKLHAALDAYLRTLSGEPLFARTHLLEIHAAGPHAQAEHVAALRRFAGRYRMSFSAALRHQPGLAMPSEDAIFILAAGVDQLVCAHVREGELASLPELAGSLHDCALSLLRGTQPTKRGGS
ncbi:MAG: hypothetical protein NVSMB51_09940 [Solirubrobacteraceae bacterium]